MRTLNKVILSPVFKPVEGFQGRVWPISLHTCLHSTVCKWTEQKYMLIYPHRFYKYNFPLGKLNYTTDPPTYNYSSNTKSATFNFYLYKKKERKKESERENWQWDTNHVFLYCEVP